MSGGPDPTRAQQANIGSGAADHRRYGEPERAQSHRHWHGRSAGLVRSGCGGLRWHCKLAFLSLLPWTWQRRSSSGGPPCRSGQSFGSGSRRPQRAGSCSGRGASTVFAVGEPDAAHFPFALERAGDCLTGSALPRHSIECGGLFGLQFRISRLLERHRPLNGLLAHDRGHSRDEHLS